MLCCVGLQVGLGYQVRLTCDFVATVMNIDQSMDRGLIIHIHTYTYIYTYTFKYTRINDISTRRHEQMLDSPFFDLLFH